MDHLFLPQETKPKIFEYPGRADYIGIPFLSYPVFASKEVYLEAQRGASNSFPDLQNKDLSQDETKFFATWLFCGLLQEILGFVLENLGEASLYRHEDFVCARVDQQNRALEAAFCTTNLVSLLEQWKSMINCHMDQCKEHYDHLKLCMMTTHTLLSWQSAKMESWLKTLIAATAETICIAINSTFSHAEFFTRDADCPETWGSSMDTNEQMSTSIANGWCPSHIFETSAFPKPFLQLLMFMSHSNREERTGLYKFCPNHVPTSSPKTTKPHNACTSSKCLVSGGLQNPQEPKENCTCASFRFKETVWSEVLRIVDGGVLLLRCRRNSLNPCTIDVVPYQQHEKFVAISHVWADGLGNPDENTILSCRLDCVIDALFRSWKEKFNEDATEILFWLDTLCCPVRPLQARKKVLGTLRSIYKNAEYVLVLDGELLNLSIANATDLEAGLRTLESGWMRRLWTLQEGYLAQDLWVSFKDKTFRLDALIDIKPASSPLSQRHLWTYFKFLYWSLRKSRASEHTVLQSVWGIFWAAILKRRVTEPSDEALCLGTFFNLDVDIIINAEIKDQMRVFWYLLSKSNISIPGGIVFSQQRRLDIDGYRWAPATFLNGAATDNWFIDLRPATLTDDGLVLKMGGFLVSETSISQPHIARNESPITLFAKHFQRKSICYVRDQHATWYSMIPYEALFDKSTQLSHSGSRQAGDKEPSLATKQMLPHNGLQHVAIKQESTDMMLLATVTKHVNEIRTVTPVKRVVMVQGVSFQTPFFEAARAAAHRIAFSEGFDMIDEVNLTKSVTKEAKDAAFALNDSGVAIPGQFTSQQVVHFIAETIMFTLTDQHHLDAVLLPDESRWCFT